MNVSEIIAHDQQYLTPWTWTCERLLAREAELHKEIDELKAALCREKGQRESTERALVAAQNEVRTAKQETQNLRMSLSCQCIEDLRAKLAAAEREAKSSKEAETRESSRAYQLEQENAQLRATGGHFVHVGDLEGHQFFAQQDQGLPAARVRERAYWALQNYSACKQRCAVLEARNKDLEAELAAAERRAKSSAEAETRAISRAASLEQENRKMLKDIGTITAERIRAVQENAELRAASAHNERALEYASVLHDLDRLRAANTEQRKQLETERSNREALQCAVAGNDVVRGFLRKALKDQQQALAAAVAAKDSAVKQAQEWKAKYLELKGAQGPHCADLPAFNQGRTPLTIKVKDLQRDQWIWHDKEHPSKIFSLHAPFRTPQDYHRADSRVGNVGFTWSVQRLHDGYLLTLERAWKL